MSIMPILSWSASTIYRLVDYQLFEARNMDLPRKGALCPPKRKRKFSKWTKPAVSTVPTDYLNFRKKTGGFR